MCRRYTSLGVFFFTCGIGFVASALIGGWFLRLLIGIVLIVIGILMIKRH